MIEIERGTRYNREWSFLNGFTSTMIRKAKIKKKVERRTKEKSDTQ